MAVLASGRATKSLQRKSHGLADPYEIPLSPSRRRSPLEESHVPGPMRRLKTYGHKRLKAGLRPSGQLGDRTTNYRQSLDNGSYRHRGGERAPKRQKSVHDGSQTNRRVDEGGSRTESALDDITERTRNRLIGMALEGLYATGELSSISDTSVAPTPARKEKRVTWDANIAGGSPTTKMTDGGTTKPTGDTVRNYAWYEASNAVLHDGPDAQMLDSEPLTSDIGDPLEPETVPPEDLITAGFDDTGMISRNEEITIDNGTLEKGDMGVDVAVRASVPYPASLFLDAAMDLETVNTTVGHPPEGLGTAVEVETAHPPFTYMSGGVDTDMTDSEASNNDTRTSWGWIESVQDHRTDHTSHAEFLVRWEGLGDESRTWESEETILSFAPILMLNYFKAITSGRNSSEQGARGDPSVRTDPNVREDEPMRVEQEMRSETEMRCVPVAKRGRGRPRGTKNRNGRKVIVPHKASKILGDLNSLKPSVRRRPSPLLEISTMPDETSFQTIPPLSAADETPSTVPKRGRGRPRGSGKSKLFAQVPRRAVTTSIQDVEASEISETLPTLEQSAVISSRRQTRLSENSHEPLSGDFLMPTAMEVLKAAEMLKLSRAKLRDFSLGTQSRRGRPIGSRNKAVVANSVQPADNPYKKQYVTGESNRGLKSTPATYSVFGKRPKASSGFSMPAAMETPETAGKLKVLPVGTKKRRGRPPGSRNQILLANLLPSRVSTPAVASACTQKRGRGRPRGSKNGSLLLHFYHRISKRPRPKRFRRRPQLSSRLRN